ncbi:peptidyl-prolyl cis-trans isomerase FKBP8-like [Spea bombifrons]|uniref:peptidyl-prolyl cis-trans isomerase FKBP8-like n=1 Tax=Spea bombifrons TaxID=233779 RepID=UPI00234A3CCC|nr:peptidyl-prolyl cis-trans isomerase FKBP8-like [Spea bombifrons]
MLEGYNQVLYTLFYRYQMSRKVGIVEEVMTELQQDVAQHRNNQDSKELEMVWETPPQPDGTETIGNIPAVHLQETDPEPEECRENERMLQRTPSFGKTVKFLLPPITIDDNAPQEEEMLFFQTVQEVMGSKGYTFRHLFTTDQWIDITEDKLLRKKILKRGLGEATKALPGQEVTVYLIGILEDGSLVEKDPKLSFVLDEGDVIQALELGVRSMQLGEAALLLTNGLYAFGLLGRDPDIPSDASLLYKVTLLKVRDKPSLGVLSAADRISLGNQKRECGNFHFEREEYRSAMHSYSQALSILTPNSTDLLSSEEEEEIREHRIKCLNNLAATQLKLHHFDDVINSCNAVLEMDVNNAKALYRKGKVLSERGEYEEAMVILKQALKLEPTTKAIHAELSKIVRRQKGQPEIAKSSVRPKPKAHLKLREDLNPLIRHNIKQGATNRMLVFGAMAALVLSLVTAFILMREN